VRLVYLPNVPYHDAILGGLGALALILLVALVARRGAAPVAAAAAARSRRFRLGPRFSSAMTTAAVACGLLLTGVLAGRVSRRGHPDRGHLAVHGRGQLPAAGQVGPESGPSRPAMSVTGFLSGT
jgi:hypothetical protein